MNFGSFDNVDDALDLLNKTKFPYLLIFSQSKNVFRMHSNLGDSKDNVVKLLKSEKMEEIIEYNEP